MKTPGHMKDLFSHPMILVITTVLCTASLTSLMVKGTLEENISGNSESLEVVVGEFAVRVTGKNTMDRVMNLIEKELSVETSPLKGLY